ncbi:AMP-binding protein [Corynebacterium glucuronolyticum]|uniref:AMP-binding protein n=1 Tax=Corynebacterium glucuronolyticum TaxID=39791 RepID=UPI00191CECC7|nr:AMP-binding protein [Corynebacterium glucuronolyticum]QQU88664.1 AMP-binding protein [Corynebacterium glucuronolyticum]
MKISSAITQFVGPDGNLALPPTLSVPALSELILSMSGNASSDASREARPVLRNHDFSTSREGVVEELTAAEINARVKALAVRLGQVAQPGDRAAILAENSPAYLIGFLGAMYAGLIPVPLYDPNEPGHSGHLAAVMTDCEPAVILTNRHSARAVRALQSDRPQAERTRVIAVDAVPAALARDYQPVPVGLDSPAFMQYTSGSTRTPAGVIITHRSMLANVIQILMAAKIKEPARVVLWLPLHHDMGIILAVMCLAVGFELDLMTPQAFIQEPTRWLTQLDRRADDENVYTVLPNFAFELAAHYGQPAEGLDLSAVDCIINGSEPVTISTVNQFVDTFAPFGLRRETIRPSYGLAEATLLVTTPQTDNRPYTVYFDREKLADGQAVTVSSPDNAVTATAVGEVVRPQWLVVVDPDTHDELPDGQVGELFIHGSNVAGGYYQRPEDTAETFVNRLGTPGHRAAGAPDDDAWLATGDLGAFVDGQLFITGRRKDLIVIAGRNHYPADIESTVAEATDQVSAVAAFAVPGEDVEKLIILAERATDVTADDATIIETIIGAVSAAHGVQPADVRLFHPGEIIRSSSGKIARKLNQKNYIAGK